MDQGRFDDLCRSLAKGVSRRGVLKTLGAGIAGAFVATATAPVGAAYDKHREDGSLGCGKGKHFDDNGACVCIKHCGPNEHQDPQTCQCGCTDTTPCPFDQHRDPQTCQCVCDLTCTNRTPVTCHDPCQNFGTTSPGVGVDEVFNPATCHCDCPTGNVCNANSNGGANNGLCHVACTGNTTFNPSACTCASPV